MSEFTEQEVERLKRWAATSPEAVGECLKTAIDTPGYQAKVSALVGNAIEPTLVAMGKAFDESDAAVMQKLKSFEERLQKLEAEMFRRR